MVREEYQGDRCCAIIHGRGKFRVYMGDSSDEIRENFRIKVAAEKGRDSKIIVIYKGVNEAGEYKLRGVVGALNNGRRKGVKLKRVLD